MHFIGTDLDFKGLPALPDQRRMKGLVHIRFRHGNIILETSRDRLIHFMNNTKCCIAVLDSIYNNTDREQIVDLFNGFILVLHFLIDTEKVLDTTVNMGFDSGIFNVFTDFIHDILDVFLTFTFTDCNFIYQIVIRLRFEIF